MVIGFFLFAFWKTVGDGGAPNDEELLLFVIIAEFRCPDVDGGRFVFHDRDEALGGPVDEIFGGGVAEAFVTAPGGGPHEVEGTVGTLLDAWIAEDLSAHLRGEERSWDVGPVVAIVAVEVVQAILAWLPEGGEYVDVFAWAAGET